MLSDERQSQRSPTTSRTGPYRDGPASRATDRGYQQRSSIDEENDRDNEYEEPSNDIDEETRNEPRPQRNEDPYISALRHRFPNRPKNDYSYSKPLGPSSIPSAPPLQPTTLPTSTTSSTSTTTARPTTTSTGTQRNGSYDTPSRPSIGGANTGNASGESTFRRPILRPVNPADQNTYAKRVAGDTTPPNLPSKSPTLKQNVRINEENNTGLNRSNTTGFSTQPGAPRTQESIFESIHSQGGPVSYLGTGTFSQFEHCLRECLERERRQTGIASQIIRQDIPPTIPVNDYGYDPAVVTSSSSSCYPLPRSSSSSHFIDYPSRAMGSFTIDDIRHINVALSRNNISLFPYERPFCYNVSPSFTSRPHTYPTERLRSGDVVSACRVVEDDPALLYNRNGCEAVQNVWNSIRNHPSSSYIDDSR
ncbi:unnamed protein product [Adineta steineri]|uniref:Uncharacterized protein n=1 Tax=Adineta steineri TaxID=433720 RepID=A0A814TWZ5_9BILA|nr:unnamed protein product [Adineta steineri]